MIGGYKFKENALTARYLDQVNIYRDTGSHCVERDLDRVEVTNNGPLRSLRDLCRYIVTAVGTKHQEDIIKMETG